ncbi:MAG TPA: porin [Paracoccus solventivorans]|uniref:Porin n=1 Tax=Paracoccus solventivorans TaxID=53463 RepID=A0A832PL65_9RHOB|nr:porin [Paracoccus solventivorans]HHW33328.1 porin [Paracoccus solventivorans]
MKKALLATTALVLSAGVAAADVKLSGYGRTGIIYYESDLADAKETQVISRLRMNLDATTETDAGVEFGGRLRLQYDQNADSHDGSHDGRDMLRTQAGKLWISAQGLTVEVGNIETAIDSSSLIYATELGAFDRSVGFSDVTGNFFAYTDGYANAGRVGVGAAYTFGDLTVRASYINPDQTRDLVVGEEKEIGLLAEYTWNDQLELSAAYTQNGAGIDDNDIFFVGARFAVMENARIGLNYVDAGEGVLRPGTEAVAGTDPTLIYDEDGDIIGIEPGTPAVAATAPVVGDGKTFALYGDYTLADGLTNIEAYVARNDQDWRATKTAYGIGVNYDLGGARLGASIQRDYNELVTADMGVRFNF